MSVGKNGRGVFTTGQVGRICGASMRTVAKWCDRKLLASYTIPCSRQRRIRREDLAAFMAAHGIPSSAPELFCPPRGGEAAPERFEASGAGDAA